MKSETSGHTITNIPSLYNEILRLSVDIFDCWSRLLPALRWKAAPLAGYSVTVRDDWVEKLSLVWCREAEGGWVDTRLNWGRSQETQTESERDAGRKRRRKDGESHWWTGRVGDWRRYRYIYANWVLSCRTWWNHTTFCHTLRIKYCKQQINSNSSCVQRSPHC